MSASTWAERQWQALARDGYRFDHESCSMRNGRHALNVPRNERNIAKAASDAERLTITRASPRFDEWSDALGDRP